MTILYPNWFDQVYLKNSLTEGVVFNAGGKITAFYTGTSDEAPVYNESDSPISQPVIIGTDGRAQFKLNDAIHYDIFIVDDNDNPITSKENVYLGAPSSGAGSGNLKGSLTAGKVPVASGAEDLEDGSITDDGSTVTLSTPLDVANNPIVNTEYQDFELTPTVPAHVEGRQHWDEKDGTMSIDLANDVSLQVGQEILIKAKNGSGVDNPNGSVVYITGSSGQRVEVNLAEADNSITSRATIGIATQDVGANNTGFYTSFGLVRDIDTSGFNEGDSLFLGTTPGEIVNVPPTKPNRIVFVGVCVRAHAIQGSIYVKVSPSFYLNELSDVSADSPVDQDILVWNASTSLYELVNLSTVLDGYLTQVESDDTLSGLGTSASPLSVVKDLPYATQSFTSGTPLWAKIATVTFTGDNGSAEFNFSQLGSMSGADYTYGTVKIINDGTSKYGHIYNGYANSNGSPITHQSGGTCIQFKATGGVVDVYAVYDDSLMFGQTDFHFGNLKELDECTVEVFDNAVWTGVDPSAMLIQMLNWTVGNQTVMNFQDIGCESLDASGSVSGTSVTAGSGGITSSGNIEGDTTDTINLGSITKRFLNIHGFWGFFTGLLTASGGILTNILNATSHISINSRPMLLQGTGANGVQRFIVKDSTGDNTGFEFFESDGVTRQAYLVMDTGIFVIENATTNGSLLLNANGTGKVSVNKILSASSGIETPITKWYYWGDEATDGSWRQGVVSGDFVTQLRISGTWTTKQTVLA